EVSLSPLGSFWLSPSLGALIGSAGLAGTTVPVPVAHGSQLFAQQPLLLLWWNKPLSLPLILLQVVSSQQVTVQHAPTAAGAGAASAPASQVVVTSKNAAFTILPP